MASIAAKARIALALLVVLGLATACAGAGGRMPHQGRLPDSFGEEPPPTGLEIIRWEK